MQRGSVCSGVLLSFNKVFTMTQDEARQKAINAGVESLKAGFANVFDHDEWLKALNLALDIFTEQCGFIKEAPKQGQGLEKGVYVAFDSQGKAVEFIANPAQFDGSLAVQADLYSRLAVAYKKAANMGGTVRLLSQEYQMQIVDKF
ncbi:hypothetical protein [Bartonella sp. HY761]|uniref:hypothetical protein n=1 Tax=Bartonella sp. HY761 TaxID=2979330 RepID=UPI002205807C|nr:hypothetical protein [Bartonella sp. HY761]UXN05230.1 hypothetical protein N6A79_07830 [Bartonella sp. HY761]